MTDTPAPAPEFNAEGWCFDPHAAPEEGFVEWYCTAEFSAWRYPPAPPVGE